MKFLQIDRFARILLIRLTAENSWIVIMNHLNVNHHLPLNIAIVCSLLVKCSCI